MRRKDRKKKKETRGRGKGDMNIPTINSNNAEKIKFYEDGRNYVYKQK